MLKYTLIGLAVVCGLTVANREFAHADTFKSHHDYVLGTSFDLVVVAPTQSEATRVETAILEEIERLNSVFSLRQESELRRLNATHEQRVSTDLLEVWNSCEAYRVETDQALSCRVGELVNEWSVAAKSQTLPQRPELRIKAGEIRRADVEIDEGRATIQRPDIVQFNMDALAKGYILDSAVEVGRAAAPSAEGLLLNIGGDIRVWGKGSDDGGQWKVAVTSESELADGASAHGTMLKLTGGAVATSAQSPRSLEINGQEFGHIISPADGWPVSHIKSASVYAASAIEADAIATALMVMELKGGLEFIESKPGVEAEIISSDGRHHATSGWSGLLLQNARSDEVGAVWPDGTEFAVSFEIPEHNVADYERPYVAVWIADAERNLVRILMLAGEEARWMEENYYWHRRFGRKAGSLVDAVSGPTRRPGEYTLKWDGLNDDGEPVPEGEYTLHLEAAREHGGHQHERLSFTLSDQAIAEKLEAGEELGAIAITFGKTG